MTKRHSQLLVATVSSCLAVASVAAITMRASASREPVMKSKPANAKTVSRTAHVPTLKGQRLHVVVNGKEHPELIPTDYAYRHLLIATAPSEALTAKEQAHIKARIKLIGLSREDSVSYESTLRDLRLRDELLRIGSERQSLDGELDRASIAAIKAAHRLDAERRDLMARAKIEVLRNVSPDGATQIQRHLESYVKPRIQIFGGIVHAHGDSSS